MAELTAEDAAWLRNLPFTLRLRDEVIVVHAGVVPGRRWPHVLWQRKC